MLHYLRTDSANQDFLDLVAGLDRHLAVINGAENDFFAQYNQVDLIRHVVVAYKGDLPVGCGAIKEYEPQVMEVKRMFVRPEERGQGIASGVLRELENWAREMRYSKCVLETADQLEAAIGLYKKSAYWIIPNYGQYAGVETSVCFEKRL